MAKIKAVFLLALVYFVYHVNGAGTHGSHNHVHGESTETDGIRFSYEPALHHFVAITSSTCFTVPLTRDERDHVHTTTGLADLELKMMREWIGQLPEVKIYHDDTHLPENLRKWCASKDIYLLERDINVMTSPKSPLASVSP